MIHELISHYKMEEYSEANINLGFNVYTRYLITQESKRSYLDSIIVAIVESLNYKVTDKNFTLLAQLIIRKIYFQ